MRILCIFGIWALLNFACQVSDGSKNNPVKLRFSHIDSIMVNVNSYAFALIQNDSTLIKVKGVNAQNTSTNEFTIFEGASLSKTLFAYMFWQMRKEYPALRKPLAVKACDGSNMTVDPLALLRHSIRSTDSCLITKEPDSFQYSENNYLLLQKIVEQYSGKSLEALAQIYIFKPFGMNNSSFIWQEKFESNYVNGFYENNKVHRSIRKSDTAKANGTLFTCLHDLQLFAKKLLQSEVPDSILKYQIPVKQYGQLSWGNGMGTDKSLGHTLLWQWGCNWSYNHILIIDKEKQLILIALSNSIIGAKRLRETCNHLFNKELELFNYINWY